MTVARIGFLNIQIWDVLDIAFVSIVFYYIIMLLRGTRATQIMLGIVALVLMYLIASWARLDAIAWLMSSIWRIGLIALVIVFQPELRGVLAKIGTYGVSGIFTRKRRSIYGPGTLSHGSFGS